MGEVGKRTGGSKGGRDGTRLGTGFWGFWMYVEIGIAVVLLVWFLAAVAS
jgi:hypothetical protein